MTRNWYIVACASDIEFDGERKRVDTKYSREMRKMNYHLQWIHLAFRWSKMWLHGGRRQREASTDRQSFVTITTKATRVVKISPWNSTSIATIIARKWWKKCCYCSCFGLFGAVLFRWLKAYVCAPHIIRIRTFVRSFVWHIYFHLLHTTHTYKHASNRLVRSIQSRNVTMPKMNIKNKVNEWKNDCNVWRRSMGYV